MRRPIPRRAALALVAGLLAAGLSAAGASAPSRAETAAHAEASTGALGEMTLGDPDAPVTLIEYASLTCSHCAHFHKEGFPQLKRDYIDAGKVRFILREMPVIPSHPALIARSYAGSMLARCAADRKGPQGYFAAMDALFDRQESWAFGKDPRSELLEIAAESGLDEDGFDACLAREDILAHIDDNIALATDKYEIEGTPGFIIDGAYQRFTSFDQLFRALDAEIAKRPGEGG